MRYDPEVCARAMVEMNGDEAIYRIFAAAVQGPEALRDALLEDIGQLCSVTDFAIPPEEVRGSRDGRRYIVQGYSRIGFRSLLDDLVENDLVPADDITGLRELLGRDSYSYSNEDVKKIETELRLLLV